MIRKIYLSLIVSSLTYTGFAQYGASSIPDSLKEDAAIVKRLEEVTFHVKDVDNASLNMHKVYTIMNEKGRSKLFFYLTTTRAIKIDEVDIRVYSEAGTQLAKYKKRDLNKEAYQGGLVEDGMYHWLAIPANSYPLTVEINYETIYSNSLNYPRYNIQEDNESVESSVFKVIVPADLDLRYMEQKVKLIPNIAFEGKNKVYTWQTKSLKALKRDEDGAVASAANPAIIISPNKFRCFNTYGDMSTWKTFGQWAYELQTGLQALPAERQAFFADLVKNAKNDREKAAIIYEYMQKNFRYVSIQLGIGGYKPFPARFTDDKKYGDCKGLSFFMNAALKSVGVKSYTALINSQYNDEPVIEKFPNNEFNHMILCVPQAKDTIWLECTSNTIDFGHLSSNTENRYALLLTEGGGVLAATPKSSAKFNSLTSSTTISLNDDGSGNVSSNLVNFGVYKEIANEMLESKKDDQKVMLVQYLGFKQPDVFNIEGKKESLTIQLEIEKIPQFSTGSKMFINPRINPIWKNVLPKAEGRKEDYFFRYPFVKTDTTVFNLPADFVAESIPPSRQLSCEFGTFKTDYLYVKEKNQVICVAKLELAELRIPVAKYAEVKKFFDGVISEDNHKLVIKKG
jgi:hypothetical protein